MNNKIDRIFFGIVTSLVIIGMIMFISASLGILNKNEAKFYGVMSSQLILGLIPRKVNIIDKIF